MLNVGLLGAGRIGIVHAKAIASHPQSRLLAISDYVTQNAQKLASVYGASVKTSEDIIADPDIDAVLIASSTDTHADYIEMATKAGKAVLCEKPVDLDLQRARDCLYKANATGQPVMVGFNRRFDRSFAAMKAAVDAGDIGKPELLAITSFDPAPPPISYIDVSGGMFRDMTVHDFDMANFIMGELPQSILAVGSALVDPQIGAAGDIDTAVVTLTYKDGRIAVIKNSRRAAYGYDQRVELLGSTGMLQVKNEIENTLVAANAQGITSAKPTYFFLERYMPAYEAEWAAFAEALSTQSALPVSLEDGVAALAMAEAAVRSMATGKAVPLDEI